MPSITLLVHKARELFPAILFVEGDDFRWSPADSTIYYVAEGTNCADLFLHELGHASLGHAGYERDVQLLAMETEAWEEASRVAAQFNTTIDQDVTEEQLDTYRDWLHKRSMCPNCQATGQQTSSDRYQCVVCLSEWRVNEAKTCQLRRYRRQGDTTKKAPN